MGHEKALKLMGMALALYLTWIRRTGLEPREIINVGRASSWQLVKYRPLNLRSRGVRPCQTMWLKLGKKIKPTMPGFQNLIQVGGGGIRPPS